MDHDEAKRLAAIEITLGRVETLLGSLTETMRDHIKEGAKWRDEMEEALNGKAGQPGLVVRIDRLEQAAERGRWMMRAVVGAVVTLVVGALASALSG